MSIINYFRDNKKDSAVVARERLQIIVAHERKQRNQPAYLPRMQQEIIAVIQQYVTIDQDHIDVQLDHNGNCSVLELNITLPPA